ncbi:hypothetical protein BH18ACT4_BH18ACT4_11130 [soil metagenome]
MSNVDETTNVAPKALGLGRRRFLLGTGVVGVGAILAACGGDDDAAETGSTDATTTTAAAEGSTTTAGGEASGDAAVAALAASIEVLAVNTYCAALDAATSGALGDVPPAVAEFVTTAQSQHQEHLDAWNDVLVAADQPAVDAPPADLEATVNGMFAEVTDVTGAARLALLLEETAAATYLSAVPTLESPEAIQLAGSLICIDRQHAAVLHFVLGEYPVPEVFATTDLAYSA